MTVTVSPSGGPALDAKVDLGVQIIKLPAKQQIVDALGGNPSEPAMMVEAAKLAGNPKKTDIIVFDRRPWHMVGGVLFPHPQVHSMDHETILEVSCSKHQRATWWSELPFTITKVERSTHHPMVANSPKYPFEGPDAPYDARPEPGLVTGTVFVVRAQPIVNEAIGQMYKITFRMAGELIDPDMEGAP